MFPSELSNVPIFENVEFAYYKDGSAYPDTVNQIALHENTLREFAVFQAVKNNVSNQWAEFGVENGTSARYFLEFLPKDGRFHLFDSFKGLPESWQGKPAGHRCAEVIPNFDDPRITIYPGWFKDTLPLDKILGFVHIDCDLYSSTVEVLEGIQVVPGTVILFDEFFGYDGWEEHEYKALKEYDHPYKFIGRDEKYRAAIEIL